MKPERTLATAPEGQRLGILSHRSWLVSHSDAMDNHAILRGRWIRERLLGDGIPDVPYHRGRHAARRAEEHPA